MTDNPIIQASLVDVRNVGTDKELKIELRIPAEMTPRFLDIFGWPTRVSPVSVALAPLAPIRLTKGSSDDDETKGKAGEGERATFTELSRMKQAGIRCNQEAFWNYLTGRFGGGAITTPEEAAVVVRWHCTVRSRRELDTNSIAADIWDKLEADYWAMLHGMR